VTPLEALHRCEMAWRRTQPQLFWTDEVLWPDGLDDAHVPAHSCVPGVEAAVRIIEPADLHPGGLTAGAEPCWDLLRTDGASFAFPAPPVSSPPRSGGSAPLSNTTGPHAIPPKRTRAAQKEVTLP